MLNPEFQRNLWLEISPKRLLIMPVVLAIIYALIVYNNPSATGILMFVFSVIGALFVTGWGSLAVMQSINHEIVERTWDQQRLSALSAWQMAWGKLFGASIYPWFGGLICALVVLVSSFMGNHNPPRTIIYLAAAIIATASFHSWVMALRLHTLDVNRPSAPSVIRTLFFVYIFSQGVGTLAFLLYRDEDSGLGQWWGLQLGLPSLFLLMSAFALVLGLLALWRSMLTQLMVRTIPWAWALGCIAVGLIVAGFFDYTSAAFFWTAWVVIISIIASYFAFFTEKKQAINWRAVAFYVQQKNYKRMLQSLPLWLVSWVVALLFTIIYSVYVSTTNLSGLNTSSLIYHSARPLLFMLLLRTVRDAGILLFFAWRNTSRSPVGMAILTYVMLGYILPAFFWLGSSTAAQMFEPFYGINANDISGTFIQFSPLAWGAMAVHLVIVAGLLVWRWNHTVRINAAAQAADM